MAAFVLRESSAGVPAVESSQGTNLREVQKLAKFCFVMRTSGHCNINICSGSTLFCSEESFRLDLLHALANEVSPCGKKLRAICFNVCCFPQTKALSRVSGGGKEHKQGERQAKGEAGSLLSKEPDVGLPPKILGS
ncbi:uncharacterized protein LOC129045928 isoform X2 [Mirounga angustirostris]|uniref:uncharacterized protein LOC129045928 isoform X2 n=1 Tax=Mirounga angustirostris TaxID=9716 RepID=UPI0023E3EA74|nr:uncharacterized protein LOC129045928 isoform X1 [Mirounga angustirostris]XP_054364500.1 uncharacterized protein LOC129045928 isoform X1 [Mirounga angustirostris]XP_054364501.1 uncharacterized protein LOC129045928 isoform X1 [Mirounga angustirostris]